MALWAPHLFVASRWVFPTTVLLGNTATYLTALAAIRVLTLPLPQDYYWRAEQALYSALQAVSGFLFETWSGVEFCFYGDPLPAQPENVLYISNHQCTVDWVIVEILCLKQGGRGRGGRVRYILKDALKYIPMYGWQLGARGGIFIKKEKMKDPDWLKSQLESLRKKNQFWLAIFPEGTRFDPSKTRQLERSWSYADTHGIPRMNNVLAPKTMGFEVALDTLRSHVSAVYDLTIVYEGVKGHSVREPPPNMFAFFSGVCRKVHVHIRRVPIDELPLSREDQRQWLYDTFSAKEEKIKSLMATGSYPAPQRFYPLPLNLTILPTLVGLSAVLLAVSTQWGRRWWMTTVLIGTLYGFIAARRM